MGYIGLSRMRSVPIRAGKAIWSRRSYSEAIPTSQHPRNAMVKNDQTRTLPSLTKYHTTMPAITNISSMWSAGEKVVALETINSFDQLLGISESEVLEMTDICSSNIDYTPILDAEHPEYSKASECLTKLITLAKSHQFDGMEGDTMEKLLHMIRLNIFHTRPAINKSVIFGDSPSMFFLRNERRLRLTYELFESIIHIVFMHIKLDDIENLFEVFKSPSQLEQGLALNALEVITANCPHFMDYVISLANQTIQKFNDGLLDTYCPLISIFRFLVKHYDSNPPSRKAAELFKLHYYPTLLSPHVGYFYQTLCHLTVIFQARDGSTAMWCYEFLLRKWPSSCASKQVIYLHQMQSLLSTISVSMLPRIQKSLSDVIIDCMTSPNFKVAIAALEMCHDEGFVRTLVGVSTTPTRDFFPALNSATRHWNDNVKASAQKALVVFNRVCIFNLAPGKRRMTLFEHRDHKLVWNALARNANADQQIFEEIQHLDDVYVRSYSQISYK